MSKKLSATNILHYNQFLLYLDSLHSNPTHINHQKEIRKIVNKEDLEKESIQKSLEKINIQINSQYLNSSLLYGYHFQEKQDFLDPNLVLEELIGEKKNRKIEKLINNKKKEKKNILLEKEIHSLNELIEFIHANLLKEGIEYSINMKSLHDIKDSLIELNSMIGLASIKTSIVDQILYFAQDLHKGLDLDKDLNKKDNKDTDCDYMHTVLYGPPGTGKTEIAKILGKIFSKLGLLETGKFKKVTRSDLVAGYLGQTAIKTKEVIKECIGGVLFIDEAYSLGNSEKKDSFSKECLDTLCESLSNHKHELMVIIAGYEKELNDCFFIYNQGLDSRFTWRYKLEKYSEKELFCILEKKIKDNGWTLDPEINKSWFNKKMDYFQSSGRDIESLFTKVKISHSRRIFGKPDINKKVISEIDLEKGFEFYCKNNNNSSLKKEKEDFNKILSSMYV
jgi:SpoVK/Ycf46/Vps4 family AAA+-type ATPase